MTSSTRQTTRRVIVKSVGFIVFSLPLKQLNYPCAIWYLAVLVDLGCLSAALGCLCPRSTEPKQTGRRPRARCSSPKFKTGNIWILASHSATDSQPPLAWAESLFLQAAECLHTQTQIIHKHSCRWHMTLEHIPKITHWIVMAWHHLHCVSIQKDYIQLYI